MRHIQEQSGVAMQRVPVYFEAAVRAEDMVQQPVSALTQNTPDVFPVLRYYCKCSERMAALLAALMSYTGLDMKLLEQD